MCGIVALFDIDHTLTSHDVRIAQNMMEAIRHRGLYRSGEAIALPVPVRASTNGRAGYSAILGINRLPIVDLKAAQQPLIHREIGSLLVCNGEIYNHRRIRDRLPSEIRAQSLNNGDAEVISLLYAAHGKGCANHLHGMFACFLYDVRKHTFLVLRDRFGVKPLFYARSRHYPGRWYFASELKAFIAIAKSAENLDDVDYATIDAVPPGHLITPEGGIERWYRLSVQSPLPELERDSAIELEERLEQYTDEAQQLIEKSVESRMMSDIPVGTFLSGGIDSTLITTLAYRLNPEIHVFTIGLEGSSDLAGAREVAAYLGIRNHHVIPFTPKQVNKMIERTVWHTESYNPIIVYESIMLLLIAEAAAEREVRVLLSGIGADELFGGYNLHRNRSPEESRLLSRRLLSNLGFTECRMADLAGMAATVEVREPYLDHQLVEYVLRLPRFALESEWSRRPEGNAEVSSGGRFDGIISKLILRRVAGRLLPVRMAYRPKVALIEGCGLFDLLDLGRSDHGDLDEAALSAVALSVTEGMRHPSMLSQRAKLSLLHLQRIWQSEFGRYLGASPRIHRLCGAYPYGDEEFIYTTKNALGSDQKRIEWITKEFLDREYVPLL